MDNLQKTINLQKPIDRYIWRCYNSSHERRGDENIVIVKLISHLMLYVLLTVAAIGDFKNFRISNRLILTGLGFAFLFRLVGGQGSEHHLVSSRYNFSGCHFIFFISFRYFRGRRYQVIFSSMWIYKFKIYRDMYFCSVHSSSGIWPDKYGTAKRAVLSYERWLFVPKRYILRTVCALSGTGESC